VLWLFTDARRLPDPLPAIARLPRGLCGVVFRHDGAPDRAALAKKIARLCRARRLALVVAGDARLAASLGAGVHLRGGRRMLIKGRGLITSSAHGVAQMHRAKAACADIIFLSPAFATTSHEKLPGHGAARWNKLARAGRASNVYALGGISGRTILSLTGMARGAAAISAFQ